MANSYRSQANLQLLLAEKHLRALQQGDDGLWGQHRSLVMTEGVVLRLRLAYACHLADLLDERQLTGVFHSAHEAQRALGEDSEKVPELTELSERESGDWLRQLLQYDYIKEPSSGDARTAELLAVDRGDRGPEPADLELWLANLQELIARHRDTMFEY